MYQLEIQVLHHSVIRSARVSAKLEYLEFFNELITVGGYYRNCETLIAEYECWNRFLEQLLIMYVC